MPETAIQAHLEIKKTQKIIFPSFNQYSTSMKHEMHNLFVVFITLHYQHFISRLS